jgi:hypothetical protein
MPYGAAQLLGMSQRQLDGLFRQSEAGPIPHGWAEGTILVAPGTALSPLVAEAVRRLAWKGKMFDAKRGIVRNRVLPFGLPAVAARVYRQASWLDGKDCIVLDYSRTSLIAHWIRDEIRLIGPGLYLGRAYGGRTKLFDFVLQF